jgi:putative ABC transport system ATP-binding protein
MTALVRAEEVHRTYAVGETTVRALNGVTLEIARGSFTAVVGPSGCGKSTLLNLLGAVDRPSAGRIEVDGRDITRFTEREATAFRLRTVGFVFQRFHLVAMLSALENVELPMAEAGVATRERRARASSLLEFVGLGGRAAHRPAQLSGGEQQRVAIARALANQPPLLLADEPTGELDAETGAGILALFRTLAEAGTTLVVVTHDEALARIADRVVRMRDGRIAGIESA